MQTSSEGDWPGIYTPGEMDVSVNEVTNPRPRGAVTVEVEPVPDLPGSFRDVPGEAWYSGAVQFVSESGLMDGCGGGLFQPDRILTRVQTAQMLKNYLERKA